MCINTPVFNCRDAKIGPDAIHAFKRDPRTGMWNPTQTWDFILHHPESLHQTMMIYTDRGGCPMSYRYMHAWGCNTYSFYNANKERVWVKFHLVSCQGAKGLDQVQAKILAGEDPNFLSRDLWQVRITNKTLQILKNCYLSVNRRWKISQVEIVRANHERRGWIQVSMGI
jgi:catalase